MLYYGSKLKRKESVSATVSAIFLSYLYLLSATLKQDAESKNDEDFPLVRFASEYCLYEIQSRFNELIKNFPNRFLGFFLRILIFPLGNALSLNQKIF